MKTVDFTDCKRLNKAYSGANGNKLSILYENEVYMLKFPSNAKKNPDMSYTNGCFSEYIGCSIYKSIGIPVQDVILGTYRTENKEKIVVACRDFTKTGIVLQDFASLKNQIVDTERNGYGTDLTEIKQTFEEQLSIDPISLSNRFWDMFIVDALIGNWDRHNGNWGFLYDTADDTIELAPVYDCGSCLYPQADENIMKKTLADSRERDLRVYEIPVSAVLVNGKKIKYFDFISSLCEDDCNRALERIMPLIDMKKICGIIEETPYLSPLQQEFYKTMLEERYEKILVPAYEKILSSKKKSERNDLLEDREDILER